MVDPVGGVEKGLHLAGLFAVGAGLEADGEEDEREASGETALHHQALVLGLVVRALRGAGGAVVTRVAGGCRSVGAVFFAGGVAFDVGAGGEGLVGVDADDADLWRQVGELADGAGVGVRLVDSGGVRGGVLLGVEDAVGLVAGDQSMGIAAGSGSADGAVISGCD